MGRKQVQQKQHRYVGWNRGPNKTNALRCQKQALQERRDDVKLVEFIGRLEQNTKEQAPRICESRHPKLEGFQVSSGLTNQRQKERNLWERDLVGYPFGIQQEARFERVEFLGFSCGYISIESLGLDNHIHFICFELPKEPLSFDRFDN